MADKILFVDDEPAVLEGYKRALYPEFALDIAEGAAQALLIMEAQGPYSVVVSDMRMPVMNGAEFLGNVRQSAPDTVRMLLTGYTDLGSAIEAINHGNIFRFLTKPCEPEDLASALNCGLEQYRLLRGERELLENTLLGSIKVLTDVLSAANPEAFGRSMRIVHYVRHILSKLDLPVQWWMEAAAALSQLGCITVDTELMMRAYAGAKLTLEEQAGFEAHPQAAREILKNIPRLEGVSWIIAQQFKVDIPQVDSAFPGFSTSELLRGAEVLKLAVAFESLREKLPDKAAVIAQLRERPKEFTASLVKTLLDLQPTAITKQLRKVSTTRLRAGMVLDQEIRNAQRVLLVAKGQELTNALILRLENHAKAGTIDKEVMAFVPM